MNDDSRREFEEAWKILNDTWDSPEGLAKYMWNEAVAHTERRLLLSKVVLPERKIVGEAWEVDCCDRYSAISFNDALDSIKIVPVSVEDILPSEDEFHLWADKGDCPTMLDCYQWLRQKITERMGGK